MEAFIYDWVRTPRMKVAKEESSAISPIQMLGTLFVALNERNSLHDFKDLDELVLGVVDQIGAQGSNLAKTSLLYHDFAAAMSGFVVNHFCCSGLTAVNLCASQMHAGLNQLSLAGGVESLSLCPLFSDKGSWFADAEVAQKTNFVHMVLAADLVANKFGYSLAELDHFALRSHRLALQAQERQLFHKSLVPLKPGNYGTDCSRDEKVRVEFAAKDAPAAKNMLANLEPLVEKLSLPIDINILESLDLASSFQPLHTLAHAPAQVDGAALMLIGSQLCGQEKGLKARARILTYVSICSDPILMLTGHITATKKALKQLGMTIKDIDLFEVSESFSASVLHYQDSLGIPEEKLNIYGGAIALGHPLGATGAMMLGTLLDSLEERNLHRGLAAICAGAGIGVCTVIERV